jgi:membrane dipeptidase
VPVPVLDGHNDVLLVLEEAARRGEALSFADGAPALEIDGPTARAGGLAGGFFACFTPAELNGPDLDDAVITTDEGWEIPYDGPIERGHARDVVVAMVARALRLEEAGAFRIARTAADVEAAVAGGPFAAILHVEGAEAIDPDELAFLDVLHAAGLRSLGPVWSRPNAFGTGVPFRCPASPDQGPGLSAAGERLVRACNAKGILVDLAHLNRAGFDDVAAVSTAPLVATHTAAHALTPTARNLTDEQLDAIGASGGLVGVIANGPDVQGEREGEASLADVVRHATYVAERIGIDHVAFGSDWNGASPPEGLERADRLPSLLEALRETGWNEDHVRAFAHGNWLRVLRETWR